MSLYIFKRIILETIKNGKTNYRSIFHSFPICILYLLNFQAGEKNKQYKDAAILDRLKLEMLYNIWIHQFQLYECFAAQEISV